MHKSTPVDIEERFRWGYKGNSVFKAKAEISQKNPIQGVLFLFLHAWLCLKRYNPLESGFVKNTEANEIHTGLSVSFGSALFLKRVLYRINSICHERSIDIRRNGI